MVELVGEAPDAGTKLKLVLDKLRQVEAGPARIANLCRALETGHVSAKELRDCISALQAPPSDTFDAYGLLLDHIRKHRSSLYFRRPSPPVWDQPIALVLDWALLDQGLSFHLFSDDYIKRSKRVRRTPGEVVDAIGLEAVLDYIRGGFREGLGDTGLGERFRRQAEPGYSPMGRVVFVTPVDDFWNGLTAQRFRSADDPIPATGSADQVLDYLGLPYRSTWLIELRSHLTLRELVRQGDLEMAAPTVLEAWTHKYFRHWPRDAIVDTWGKTLHLGNGQVGASNPPGLPEAIVDHLSPRLLSSAFEVSILGEVSSRPIPDQQAVDDFLVAKRDVATLINDIVLKVMGP